MYVRTWVECEQPETVSARRSLLLKQAQSLFLTEPTLLSAGYRISTRSAPSMQPIQGTGATVKRDIPSVRGRLRPPGWTEDAPQVVDIRARWRAPQEEDDA